MSVCQIGLTIHPVGSKSTSGGELAIGKGNRGVERDQDQGDQGCQKQLRGVQVGSQLVTPMSRGPFERNGLRKTETDGDRLVARPVLDGDTGPGSGYIGWNSVRASVSIAASSAYLYY